MATRSNRAAISGQVMVERYGLSLDMVGGSLDNIPRDGPLILIANHPYGILDGLMLGHILSQVRGDFRILAHRVFRKAEDINRIILPISFDDTKEALALNIQTRKDALRFLSDGGAIGIFPRRHRVDGGQTLRPADGPRLAQLHRADDREVRGDGRAALFRRPQFAPVPDDEPRAHHPAHGASDQGIPRPRELARPRRGGEPIPREELAALHQRPAAMMAFLREKTYALSPTPLDPNARGFEFEDQYRDKTDGRGGAGQGPEGLRDRY
jgi:hypothetical protein